MYDERVRSSSLNPPPVEAFSSDRGTPIIITESGEAWVLTPDGRVVMIGEGMSMEQEVATTGLYRGRGAELVTVLGGRSLGWSSTSTFGDVVEYLDTSQAAINDVSSGTTYYLVSTSAQDAVGGAGVDTVHVVYLDANGVEQHVTKTLTGTTPVSLGSGFTYFQYMESEHSTTSGRVAAGNITISSTNGAATVATTVERISAGGNRSLSGRWKCPSDCEAFLLDWWASAIGNTMDTRLRGKWFTHSGDLSTAFHFLDRAFLASGQVGGGERHYQRVPPGGEVKFSAIPGGTPAGNKLDVNFELICVKLA